MAIVRRKSWDWWQKPPVKTADLTVTAFIRTSVKLANNENMEVVSVVCIFLALNNSSNSLNVYCTEIKQSLLLDILLLFFLKKNIINRENILYNPSGGQITYNTGPKPDSNPKPNPNFNPNPTHTLILTQTITLNLIITIPLTVTRTFREGFRISVWTIKSFWSGWYLEFTLSFHIQYVLS